MNRRTFLHVTSAAAALSSKALANSEMPMRKLGNTDLVVSRITLGGYHYLVNGEENGIELIHRAIDLGVNFFDSAHKYNSGASDFVYGKALPGWRRKKVLLMGKAQFRTRNAATQQLNETLRRMKTDYLDLWQVHEVVTHDEVDKILGPDGALEAFVKAKEEGKVRYIGFSGHRDYTVHQRMIESFDGWDTVQHPVNLIDQHHRSFIDNVIPKARAKGIGVIGMKSNAIGQITKQKVAAIPECLRFAWSQDIDTLVSGVQTIKELDENVASCKTFQKMSPQEMKDLLSRTKKGKHGPDVEQYKRMPKTTARGLHIHMDGEPG